MSKASTESALQLTDLEAICAGFGLKLLVASGRRKVWCLNTTAGYKYLKQFKLSLNSLSFIYQALEYLHERGFSCVPRFLLNMSGQPYLTHQDCYYIMTDWCFSRELCFKDQNDLEAAIRFLADFHGASTGFIAEPANHERCAWLDWPVKWETRICQLEQFRTLAKQEEGRSAFSRLYLAMFTHFYREALDSYEKLLNSPYQLVAREAATKKSFCHHDYSDRNLLRTEDQKLFLVDFDYCLSDLRLHDLINLTLRILKHNDWNSEHSRFILENYHAFNALSIEELEVMRILLNWPQDFWQVGLQYYYEKLPWPEERFLKKLETISAQLTARESFLKQFPNENGIYLIK